MSSEEEMHMRDQLDEAIDQAGGSFEDAVRSMSPDAIRESLKSRCDYLDNYCKNLQGQLTEVKQKLTDDNKAVVARIEKLACLMTTQMACIRQVVELCDGYNDKIEHLQADNSKRELQISSIVDRQNRFAVSISKLAKTSEEVVSAIEDLKQKDDEHDKFQWRIWCIFSLGAAVITWLLAGDHLAQIVVAIERVLSK